jgi:hypothetical protein
MKQSTRLFYSLVINAIVFLLCVFTTTNAYFGYWGYLFGEGGVLMFRYCTNETLILLGLSSLPYVIFGWRELKSHKPIPPLLKTFPHLTMAMTMGVVLVVIFFLAPWYAYQRGPLAYFSLFGLPTNLFAHLVIPFGALLSYLVYEEPYWSPHSLWIRAIPTMAPMLLYAGIVSTLATLHLLSSDPELNNVYGFMDLASNPWWVSVITGVTALLTTYFEGVILFIGQAKLMARYHQNALVPRSRAPRK